MSVNISVLCFKSKTLSNGEHPLFVKVSEGKKRATKSLGLSIRAQFWNFEKNEPKKSCPNREDLIKMIESKKKLYLEKNAIRHWQICRRRLIWLSFVPLRKPLWIS